MTLAISTIFISPTKEGLVGKQKFSFGFDIVTGCALAVLGILCIIQLGAGHQIWSGIGSFSTLQGFASHGGILAVGFIWFASSVVTFVYLRKKRRV